MKYARLFLLASTLAAGACEATNATGINPTLHSEGIQANETASDTIPNESDAGVPGMGSGN